MKPAAFEYIAPKSDVEAVAQLARYAGDARMLAGGQSLIALMNLRIARPTALIDLGRCPGLSYIRREGDWLAIGPMTRQAEAEHSPLVRECCPLLAKALPYLGPATIRNRGTVGGTLAHADRVAELPGVALALDAELIAQGPNGRRTIPAREFFIADLTTALKPDEMLREARFPVAGKGTKTAFVETGNRHHDLALAGVAVQLQPGEARLAAIGVGAAPVRLRAVEAALLAGKSHSEAAKLSLEDAIPAEDMHASAEYRSRVLVGLVERALKEAS